MNHAEPIVSSAFQAITFFSIIQWLSIFSLLLFFLLMLSYFIQFSIRKIKKLDNAKNSLTKFFITGIITLLFFGIRCFIIFRI